MVDIEAFAADGFVKVAGAAPRSVADAARGFLWQQIGLSPDDPSGWAEPVRWASDPVGRGPFGEIAKSAKVAEVLDRICGPGAWQPRGSLGNIPVRFPVSPPNEDRGWHIDANTPMPDGSWAVTGRPHTVLLLTLLSDVGPDDAPTRIRIGSHRDVARILGPDPIPLEEMGALVDSASAHRPIALATGDPGDVYVVHPLTAHAADEHRGRTPRFMAQAPVVLTEPLGPTTTSPLGSAYR